MSKITILHEYPIILTKDTLWLKKNVPSSKPGTITLLPPDAVLVMLPPTIEMKMDPGMLEIGKMIDQKEVMVLTDKQLSDLRQIVQTQGDNGNWNYDPYMLGMFNGMELMLATVENREPRYRTAPEQWVHNMPELTDKPGGTLKEKGINATKGN